MKEKPAIRRRWKEEIRRSRQNSKERFSAKTCVPVPSTKTPLGEAARHVGKFGCGKRQCPGADGVSDGTKTGLRVGYCLDGSVGVRQ